MKKGERTKGKGKPRPSGRGFYRKNVKRWGGVPLIYYLDDCYLWEIIVSESTGANGLANQHAKKEVTVWIPITYRINSISVFIHRNTPVWRRF